MIVRLSLGLIPLAIASFLFAMALEQLQLPTLSVTLLKFGSILLLSAFTLFLLAALVLLSKQTLIATWDYFSPVRRMERNILFLINKHNRLTRLFYFKKQRLLYLNQQRRKRLFKKYA